VPILTVSPALLPHMAVYGNDLGISFKSQTTKMFIKHSHFKAKGSISHHYTLPPYSL